MEPLTFEEFQIEVHNTLADCYVFRLKDLGDCYTFDNIGGVLSGSYDGKRWLVSHKYQDLFGTGDTLKAAIADMDREVHYV